MPFLWALLALVLHVLPGPLPPAHAQGTRKDDIVFNSRGVPLAGASVRVCTMPASGQPCTPLALIYSDAALTQALANPTASDGLGNYHFYAAPGKYMIEISGPGISTKQIPDVIIPVDPSNPNFAGNVSAFSLSLAGNLTVNGNTTVVGNLASGTLNLSNQSTPPGSASAGTVNLYTKTADKRLYYKDETGTEIGPLGPGNGAQTNTVNTFTAQQNIDADFHNKGPNPWYDITRYGGYSSASPPTITCATTSGQNTMTCSGGTSDFAVGHGVSVQLAGPAAQLTAPGAAVPLTALTISSNLGTISTSPFTVFAPGSTVTIAGATDSTLNGTFTVAANTNTVIGITHANCSPCNVGGTATIVATVPATVTSAGILNGSTNYSYKIVARDKNGGLSPASTAVTISTGAATLGVNSGPTLSSCNRASGVATCTTAAAHNFQAGVPVNIPRGSGDALFEGQFTIVATPTSTTFTFYQAGQADRTGTITPGAVSPQIIAKNIVKWVMQPYGQYQAYIYRCTGVSCSSYTLVGISQGMDSSFEDWGFGIVPSTVPSYISTSTPTASAVSAPLNTTVTAINGTTITLAANAVGTVASAKVLHDNGPNLRAACQAGSGTMYIPAGGAYPFNSILDLSSCAYSKLIVASSLIVNDPWLITSPFTVEGQPVGGCFPSSKLDYCAQVVGNGYPLFLFTPGVAGSNVFRNLYMACFQNYQSCVFYDQDNNGNNVSQQSFVHMSFAGCNSLPFKLGGAFGYFWDYGTLFNNTCSGNWGSPPALASQTNQGFGNIFQQLVGLMQVRNLTTGDGEWLWDDKRQTGRRTAFPGKIRIPCRVNESSHTPQLRFNLAASHVFVTNWTLDTMQYDDPVGGLAVPIFDFTNAPNITSFEVHGQGCASSTQPIFAIAPGQSGLYFEGNSVNCSIIGSDSLIVRAASQDSYLNSNVAVSGTGRVGFQLGQPAAPTVATSGASGPPAGTYNYFLLDNDVFNGTSISGLRSSNIAVNGSQGVLVTFPSFQPGKVSTTVCRSDNTGNGAACSAAGAGFRVVGNTFLDNGAFFPTASAPLQATGYSTAFGSAGIETPQVALTGGGFASTLNGSFTANRAQSFPDNSGVVPVTGYINSAYDNFNRANGAIGSNYNVTNGGINVVSNTIQGTGIGNNVAFWTANTFFTDQFAEATVTSLNGTTDFIGPSVRVSPGSNWYSCFENSTTVFIQKELAGSFTNITNTASTGAVGDILRIEAQGNNLTCYKNGSVILTATDSSLPTGSPGMQLAGSVATLDNWTAGNLHPLGQLDVEANYTKVQHLNAGVGIGTEAFSASPRAEQNVFLPGALTSTWTGATWTADKSVTVTRVQVQAKTAPAGCTTNAIVRLTDGTSPVNVTVSTAANDSGPITQNYAAGSSLTIAVQTAAAGCTTSPADANVVVQYRMQ